MNKRMAKINEEISQLRKEVEKIKTDLSQINFNVLRILSEWNKVATGDGNAIVSSDQSASSSSAVDLGPVEERLDDLAERLITKTELEELGNKIDKLVSNRIKESDETVKRLTTFLQTGLEMVKIESAIEDVKSLLEETIIKTK